MKITQLTIENVKRVSAVHIEPDGNMIVIGGMNGQGKTSVLDSIMYALGGKDAAPDKPLRRGSKSGSVKVQLDDLIVTRTFEEDGKSNLRVESTDGGLYSSPQAMLDKLVGRLSFDPLAFKLMDAKKQGETLRSLLGLDFTKLDAQRRFMFEERSGVNRDIANVKGQLQGMPESDAPDAEIDTAQFVQAHKEAMATNQANASKRNTLKTAESNTVRARQTVADAKAALEAAEYELTNTLSEEKGARAAAEGLTDIDLNQFATKIDEAGKVNQRVKTRKARETIEAKFFDLQTKADDLTNKIAGIDKQKADQIAAAKFPVPGMSFDENGVLLNGLPFNQASGAEQLRTSVAMGLAMNPKLKVLLVRDGSLLDENSLALVAEMAAGADAQVWLEKVGVGEEVSVIIEDGMVKAAQPVAAE